MGRKKILRQHSHAITLMFKIFSNLIQKALALQVPVTGLGIFRILYGLVLFQEIIFLLYFNHLIFDPIPYMDVEFPMITFFLGLWAINALCIVLGYRYQITTLVNYVFWIIFVCFTPMQRDFDGGFDPFMTGVGFLLIFLPADRSFSIDNLRLKLGLSDLKNLYQPPRTASILTYIVPVTLCLSFLYFDSAIHKLSADHWRNGLGAWLPSTQPYYISAIDMSWLLNKVWLQKTIGYTIIVFQFSFLFLSFSRHFRPVLLFLGIALHLGITLSLNIYPFGLGMLALYPLLVPFSWWKSISTRLLNKQPALTVFYDEQSPFCNRTIITINHFDVLETLEFKGLQSHADKQHKLQNITPELLLTNLYVIDNTGNVFAGLDAYIQILAKMRYTQCFSLFLRIPGINLLSRRYYRDIADNRAKITSRSDARASNIKKFVNTPSLYHNIFEQYAEQQPRTLSLRLVKIFIFILLLQINSTLHYGVAYRMDLNLKTNAVIATITSISNSLLTLTSTFFGITPHALYLHDHFKGYNHIIGITYFDADNQEQWLPFINEEGRIVAPNWGRVHSMWANIAITPNIDNFRLKKFVMKITAFWGIKSCLNLNSTLFNIKLKKNHAPPTWLYDLRNANIKQPWINIGTVQWTDKTVVINLPDDINSL
jgi:predicted DCC family thiol-disulfide oxidoreductase YuxK